MAFFSPSRHTRESHTRSLEEGDRGGQARLLSRPLQLFGYQPVTLQPELLKASLSAQ